MKIAYLLEWDISSDSGVFNKVKAQTEQWKNLGHSVELLVITPNVPKSSKEVNFFSSSLAGELQGFFKTYLNKIISIKRVGRFLKEFNPDIVYIRQAIWYPGVVSLLKRYKSVMELNTDDLSEIKLENIFKKNVYLFGREKLLNSVSGFVSVSYEITELYKKYNKPIISISNGYDLKIIPNFNKKVNKRKQVLFVGSEGQKWHGVEKVLIMAKELPEFDFHIVGPKIENKNLDNLKIYGFMNRGELFKLYQNIDIGVGTLSLYENAMQEASPLKVREYIAFGIPVVLGYIDTDLEGKEYILNIGNYENNINDNIEKIRKFIIQSEKQSKLIDKNIISYDKKEKLRLEFFEKL